MKKLLFLPLLLILTACPKVEQNARDAAAALGGAITAAQAQHQECVDAPTGSACILINRAVDGQNALITSIEGYCGWSPGVLPSDPNAKCVPVSGATAALNTAISNANQFINELKGVIK